MNRFLSTAFVATALALAASGPLYAQTQREQQENARAWERESTSAAQAIDRANRANSGNAGGYNASGNWTNSHGHR